MGCHSRLCGFSPKRYGLFHLPYVGEQYWRKVLEREQAVSTGYTGFAIPHSVSFEASSNGICVAIAPGGIDWAGKQVYVVFLMATDF